MRYALRQYTQTLARTPKTRRHNTELARLEPSMKILETGVGLFRAPVAPKVAFWKLDTAQNPIVSANLQVEDHFANVEA